MAGGKKYNIWIAYSDLFTNLSAFIFISALGAFAAIGSGTRVSPGLGAFETCSIPNAVRAELEKDGSQLRRVGEGLRPTGSREGCTEYYAVERSRYAPGEGGILDHTGRARRRQVITPASASRSGPQQIWSASPEATARSFSSVWRRRIMIGPIRQHAATTGLMASDRPLISHVSGHRSRSSLIVC